MCSISKHTIKLTKMNELSEISNCNQNHRLRSCTSTKRLIKSETKKEIAAIGIKHREAHGVPLFDSVITKVIKSKSRRNYVVKLEEALFNFPQIRHCFNTILKKTVINFPLTNSISSTKFFVQGKFNFLVNGRQFISSSS